MKPHRRKDTPPRREPGADSGSAAPEDASEAMGYAEQEEFPSGDQSGITYDPGAALVDENLQYSRQDYGYTDPPTGEEPQGYENVEPEENIYSPPPATYATGGVYDDAPQHHYEAPPPPPPPPVRKKVTHRAPQRRPVVPGRNVRGTRYQRPKPAYSGGVSMMSVFMTLVALGLLVVVAMVVLPRDMSMVAGYPSNPLASGKPRNLLEETQKIMIQRTSEISFTEEEVNHYLNQRLQAEQTGPMAALVKFRGVYVDFSPGLAEIVIERELFGRPLTMSSKIRTEKFRSKTVYHAAGWTLGSIDLGTRNIKPVIELFIRLRNTCLDEYQTIQQMVDVRFEENKLVLDSRI